MIDFFRMKVRKKIIVIFLTAFALIINVQTAQGFAPTSGGILGPQDEVFDDLFLQGTDVEISGKVHGMLFAVGETINLRASAQIENDIFFLGKNINIEEGAVINGNLYLAGQNILLQSSVKSNLIATSVTFTIDPGVIIGRNLFFGGFHFDQKESSQVAENLYAFVYQASINGIVTKNLRVNAVSLKLNGQVTQNAEIKIDSSGDDEGMRIWLPYMARFNIPDLFPPGLSVGQNASIGGKLIYTSAKDLEENLSNLPLGGFVQNISPDQQNALKAGEKGKQTNPFLLRFFRSLRHFVGLMLFGWLIWKIGKKYLVEASQTAIKKPLNALGVGFISTLVIYLSALIFLILLIIMVLLLRTLTLYHLGSSLFFLGLAIIFVVLVTFGIFLVYVSKFILAYWAGKQFVTKIIHKDIYDYWFLVIGILILLLVEAIPYLGWILGIIITLIGIGAIWFTLRSHDQAGILPDV